MSEQYDNFTVRLENGRLDELDTTITGMKASGKLDDDVTRSEVVREIVDSWIQNNSEYREILEDLRETSS